MPRMWRLKYLKISSANKTQRFEQILIDKFPNLEVIEYWFNRSNNKKKDFKFDFQLPSHSFIDTFSPNFLCIKLNMNINGVLTDEYMLDHLNMNYVPVAYIYIEKFMFQINKQEI